jgi:hypothetical protein
MRNSSKLKNILQLYTINLDMDDGECIQLALTNKRTGVTETFEHETYTKVLEQAFAYIKKGLKNDRS